MINVMYVALYNLLCCLSYVNVTYWLLLTVSHAHVKHDLNVVVDGSWVLGMALLVQSNIKTGFSSKCNQTHLGGSTGPGCGWPQPGSWARPPLRSTSNAPLEYVCNGMVVFGLLNRKL
jgi:hypothetical protein